MQDLSFELLLRGGSSPTLSRYDVTKRGTGLTCMKLHCPPLRDRETIRNGAMKTVDERTGSRIAARNQRNKKSEGMGGQLMWQLGVREEAGRLGK